ncbi:membrane protease YdiL (CAAX protease family) [Arthrobacter sp. CAN_A2]|uniref:CPBP family glutamic-type intramembrane protease n=1 Tax=Arthrobacter sp. CAN_A2 TaxID=2787718 RepID=UPI0018F00B18
MVAYFAITFTLSWGYWVIVLGFLSHQSLWWFLPGAFAPFVAAILVTGRLEGRQGMRVFMRRFILWRVGLRWYLIALVVLPFLAALSGFVLRDGSEQYQGSLGEVAATYVALVVFLTVLGGGQEEPGWRGFALPRLQERYGPLAGTVLLGLLWGLWHLPLFVFVPDYNSSGRDPAGVILTFAVFVVAGAVGQSLLLTWLYNNTGGSILLLMLAHGSLNAGRGFAASTQQATITVSLVLAVAGAIVALSTRGRLGYRKALPPGGSGDQALSQ